MKKYGIFYLLIMGLVLGACQTIKYQEISEKDALVCLNSVESLNAKDLGEFEITKTAWYGVSLIEFSKSTEFLTEASRMAKNKGADGVCALVIHEEYSAMDYGISAIQSALLSGTSVIDSRTVKISGRYFKFN